MNGIHILDQTWDARVALIIAVIGLILWSITVVANYRWLKNANGSRSFIKVTLSLSAVLVCLSLSMAYNSARAIDISNAWDLRISFFANRIVTACSPVFIAFLRRDIHRHALAIAAKNTADAAALALAASIVDKKGKETSDGQEQA